MSVPRNIHSHTLPGRGTESLLSLAGVVVRTRNDGGAQPEPEPPEEELPRIDPEFDAGEYVPLKSLSLSQLP